MRITIVYEVVKLPATRSFGSCKVCGRPGKRSKTFRQTINPFNKNKSGPRVGQPKVYTEIITELKDQAREWKPTMHAGCENK